MHIGSGVGRVPYSSLEEDALIPFFKNHIRQFEREVQHPNHVLPNHKEALVVPMSGLGNRDTAVNWHPANGQTSSPIAFQ